VKTSNLLETIIDSTSISGNKNKPVSPPLIEIGDTEQNISSEVKSQ
jgi:hypothetical protein